MSIRNHDFYIQYSEALRNKIDLQLLKEIEQDKVYDLLKRGWTINKVIYDRDNFRAILKCRRVSKVSFRGKRPVIKRREIL